MGTDGVVRIVLCVSLAVVGVTAVGPYGFAVALAPLVGVGIVFFEAACGPSPARRRPGARSRRTSDGCCSARCSPPGLVNAGPIATTLLAEPDDRKPLVTQFAYGVLLARIPLFLFQAVQAALLPRLSRLAARGEMDEFLAGFRRLMKVVGVVGIVGIARRLVSARWRSSSSTTPSCQAARWRCWRSAAPCYMVGAGNRPGSDRAPRTRPRRRSDGSRVSSPSCSSRGSSSDDLFRRVEIGLLLASLVVGDRVRAVAAPPPAGGARPDEGSMLEAITDMPLES